MTTLLICLAILTVFVLLALKMGLGKKEVPGTEDSGQPTIHKSGVYSILRQSPREGLARLRPGEEEIRKYLAGLAADINGGRLDNAGRAALLKHWKVQTEVNLREIEEGDRRGAAFYYYDFFRACPVCAAFINKGNFVTREEIYKNPQIIPPLHLGCTSVLSVHHGNDNQLRETTKASMLPFFRDDTPPPLPDWTSTISFSATAEAKK